jgi:hypothetical protein
VTWLGLDALADPDYAVPRVGVAPQQTVGLRELL